MIARRRKKRMHTSTENTHHWTEFRSYNWEHMHRWHSHTGTIISTRTKLTCIIPAMNYGITEIDREQELTRLSACRKRKKFQNDLEQHIDHVPGLTIWSKHYYFKTKKKRWMNSNKNYLYHYFCHYLFNLVYCLYIFVKINQISTYGTNRRTVYTQLLASPITFAAIVVTESSDRSVSTISIIPSCSSNPTGMRYYCIFPWWQPSIPQILSIVVVVTFQLMIIQYI